MARSSLEYGYSMAKQLSYSQELENLFQAAGDRECLVFGLDLQDNLSFLPSGTEDDQGVTMP